MSQNLACIRKLNAELQGELIMIKGELLCVDADISEVVNTNQVCHEKTDLKVFVVVIPKEGWVRVAAPILLLV